MFIKEEERSSQQRFNQFEEVERQSSQVDSSSDKKQDKLLKNRISAAKSRKIKKEYMEILEEEVLHLK